MSKETTASKFKPEWYEHNLEELAPYTKARISDEYGEEKRICFDIKYSRIPSTVNDSGFHPVIVVEGEKGYRPTTFDIGQSIATCAENVEKANKALGLKMSDVLNIITKSMQ